MPTTPHTALRLSDTTRQQLRVLAARRGESQAAVTTIAIDRMFREEIVMDSRYVTVTLTEREMKRMNDGQDWYKPGDTVILGGYTDGGVDLNVNGETVCDGWLDGWYAVPKAVRARAN